MRADYLPDKTLLKRVALNDKEAFSTIFERYKDRFYAAALKMTRSSAAAEEIVQQVFVILWQRRSSLAKVAHPESYFFTVVYNTISRRFKKIATEKAMKAQMWEQSVQSENTTERFLLEKERRQWLQNIIHRLPSQQQVIYRLSKEEGLSRKEIAKQLDISPNTVKNHLLKAMKFIKGHWEEMA